MLEYQIISFVIAVMASLIMMPWILKLCHRNGLYDTPNARKVHKSRIPRMGGVVFVPTVALGLMAGLTFLTAGSEFYNAIKTSTLLIGIGMMFVYIVGLLDDLFGVSANLKFIVQILAAMAFPLGGLYFDNLYGLFGIWHLNIWASYVITVFLVVFVMNSMNTIDGIDGLCAGLTLVSLVVYNYYFNSIHNCIFGLFIAAIIGTLLVFLCYNIYGNPYKGKKTFMGDSGSLTLGFILSYLGLKLSMSDARIAPPAEGILIPLSLLVIPTFDLVRVAIGRMLKGRHPFSPDKTHIHHLIMRAGMGQRQTLLIILVADVAIFLLNMFEWHSSININIIVLSDVVIYGISVAMLSRFAAPEELRNTTTEDNEDIKETGGIIDYRHPDFTDADIKISIIVATYNSAKTLSDTLDSILSQTYKNYEVVLCDGCSKDNTMDIVRVYEPRFKGKLKAVSEPDRGIYDAMNKGIDRAIGDVVGILNSDDFYTSNNVLERITGAFKRIPLLEAVYGDVHYVKPDNLNRPVRYYSSKMFRPRYMRMGFMPAHPSFYCIKELYTTYGKYNLDYKVAADFDQLFRLLFIHRVRAQYIDLDFVTMRTGGASNSGLNSHLQIIQDHARSMRSHGTGVSYTLFAIRYLCKSVEVACGRLRYFMSLMLILCTAGVCAAGNILFNNGRSDYSIVIVQNASISEKTAAEELQQYIKNISGAELPLVTHPVSRMIQIGWDESLGEQKPAADDQAFHYFTRNGNLYIYGGQDFGTMYGVFSFLENELGVRWYTSSYTKIPKCSSWVLPSLNKTEKPYIDRRLDFYHDALFHPEWCAHNKLNEINTLKKCKYGNYTKFRGIHTFFDLVSSAMYFEAHPEYFSFRNGRRIKDGQLCLTNNSLRTVLVNSLLKTIKDNPGYWCYDVSQMDNENYCQCTRCQKVAARYGGQSGLMIWFVNQIADQVRIIYPNVMIGTFAYMYTRHAPQNIRPRSNVVVRLCNVECCFSHPLSSASCRSNTSFMNDLRDWGKLTDRIYIWDYVADFVEYQTPYPNFRILGSNIKTFGQNGVLGVMEEGSHDAPWTEFSELRQWVIAKLLWNPDQNVDSLAHEFCRDYYGKVGIDVYLYWKSVQNLVGRDTHIHFNSRCRNLWYSDQFIENSITSLERTVSKCGNDKELARRVKHILGQVYFVYVCRHYAISLTNGRYGALKKILEEDPTIVRENKFDLDKYLITSGYT